MQEGIETEGENSAIRMLSVYRAFAGTATEIDDDTHPVLTLVRMDVDRAPLNRLPPPAPRRVRRRNVCTRKAGTGIASNHRWRNRQMVEKRPRHAPLLNAELFSVVCYRENALLQEGDAASEISLHESVPRRRLRDERRRILMQRPMQ